MLTEIRSIAVLFDESRPDSRIVEHASALAARHDAHLIGIYGTSHVTEQLAGIYVLGNQAVNDVIEQEARQRAQRFAAVESRLDQAAHARGVGTELRTVWVDGDVADLEAQLLHADLAVLEHPGGTPGTGLFPVERLLAATGIPVLMVPGDWDGDAIGRRVVVAWNGSSEARRAIGDALPFIKSAEWVEVLVVDPDRAPERHGEEPGADIARFIARHGAANVEVAQVDSQGAGIADTIMFSASLAEADLLVIGAWSHARLVEKLMGGVTETLLSQTLVPLLVSR